MKIKILKGDQIEELLSDKKLIGKGATSTTYKVTNFITNKGFLCLKILNEIFFSSESESDKKTKKSEDKSSGWSEEEDSDNESKDDDDDDDEDKAEISIEKIQQLFNENELLNGFNHPNIVKVFGFFYGDKKCNPAILLEYCKFNLEKAIKKLDDIDLVKSFIEI